MKNKVTSKVKDAAKTYYTHKFHSYINNVQNCLQLIKHLSVHKKTANNSLNLKTGEEIITCDEDIVNNFNNYFSNIASNLEEKLPDAISSPFFTLLLITLPHFIYTNLVLMKLLLYQI